ncbi:MAG: hypothetical protein IAF58_22855 [Leptolyngbya sp.]|nr:hypothetical protein [Candidatus Melainabacteria bacterium]
MTSSQPVSPLFNLYPVNLKIGGRPVLVSGGGKQALKEVIHLIDYGARVEVVSPHFASELEELKVAHSSRLILTKRPLSNDDHERITARQFFLVVPAAKDIAANELLVKTASIAGVLTASSDFTLGCDITFGETVKRGHLKMSVSTDGISPALERALINRLEGMLVNDIDNYVLFLNSHAEKLKKLLIDEKFNEADRHNIFQDFAHSDSIYRAVSRGNFEEARNIIDHQITTFFNPEEREIEEENFGARSATNKRTSQATQ